MTSRTPSWWNALTGADKFRFYTRVTLQLTLVGVLVSLSVSAADPAALPGILLAGLVAAVLVEVQPGLTTRPAGPARRVVVVGGTAALAVVWLGYAVVAALAGSGAVVRAAAVTGLFAVMALAMAVLPFVAHRWWWLVAAGGASGAAFGDTWSSRLVLGGLTLAVGAFVLATMLLTMSTLRIVDDLERARGLEARLRVADERLRFARDLHDVVGRGFSAVAVKSDLAATLARAGAADRAAAEMDEVRALAVESMGQMRRLVRGYRDIDLATEVEGARSLLSAVGCRLTVEGDPARLPEAFRDVAAWATREGTTNIVRHAGATTAVLAFGDAGMSLRNDGAHGEVHERSGLRGLAERVGHVGATLRTDLTEEEFVLEIVWAAP